MATLFPGSLVPALDSTGSPINGATWTFTRTGSSTAAAVYTDDTLATPVGTAGVVTADSAGRFAAIYLDDSVTYRAVLKDAGGATIRDVDPVNPQSTGLNVKAFGATGDGTTDDSSALNAAFATGDSLYFPDGTYRAKNLTVTLDGQTFSGPGVLKFNGTTSDKLLTVSGDYATFESLTFDGNLAQPSFALVVVAADTVRPRFIGCRFQNMLGISSGSTPVNQMYALAINPYGVTDFVVEGCHFTNLKKSNDGTYYAQTEGLGFVGGIVFMDGSGSVPSAAQTTPTSGIVTGCSFFDIQTILAGALSDANRIIYDDADAIRTYEVNGGEGEVRVQISACQFRKVSKRAAKLSARGSSIVNCDVYATDCPYFMVTAVKLNPDCVAESIRVHASSAKPIYTAFQVTGTPSSAGWRYANVVNCYISHCQNGVEFYTLTALETLENVTIDGLRIVQCYSAGILQTIPSGPVTPASMKNNRFANIDIAGGDANAGGVIISGATDGTAGVALSRAHIVNANLKLAGTNNSVDDVVVSIPSGSSWTGYSSTAGLVEIGSLSLNGINRVTGLTVSAPGLPTNFVTASRPYVVYISSNGQRLSGIDLSVPQGLSTSYNHIEIAGDDIEVNGLAYDGPGTIAIGALVACSRVAASGLTRKGSGAATTPFITSSNASNTGILLRGVTDHRRTTVDSLSLSSGSLGTGDTYVHMVQGLRTRSQAALPSTSGTVHVSDAVKF